MRRARRDVAVARACAVVIGAGIGGLAAAAGLCSAGWDVTAFERATSLEPVGAGLAGNELRALAVPQELGIRRSDGRWLMRSTHRAHDRRPVRGPGHPGDPGSGDRRPD